MVWPVSGGTIREISKALEELSIPTAAATEPCRPSAELRCILETGGSGWSRWLRSLLAAVTAGLMVWDPFAVGRDGTGSVAFLMTSTLRGYRGRLDDRRFPSGRTLAEAGLKLHGEQRLGLPAASAVGPGDVISSQVLRGRRNDRDVSSGVQILHDGRVLLRTGVISQPPCFACEIVDGHLRTTSSPMGLDSEYLSGRTGPGRVAISNDGLWLVIDRILPGRYRGKRAMLLLRQLRDIALAEKLSSGACRRESPAFV